MFLPPPRVKICCISSDDEAALAIHYGASAIGLVSEMPSGPGPIQQSLIRSIARTVPPGVATFLLTSKTEGNEIVEQQRYCRTNTLQLVDEVSTDVYEQLRAELPGISLVQVIHVVDETAIGEARRVSPHVDAVLLDSGNPRAPIKELGGTGRQHNWTISRRIVESVEVPVYLAGGVNASNVNDAITQVRPFGVDVCSGLRTGGKLDESKVAAFMTAVRRSNPS